MLGSPTGPNFMALLNAEFCAYDHHSALARQASNFCASCVSVDSLVMWSTHAHKPKFPAYPWVQNSLLPQAPIFCLWLLAEPWNWALVGRWSHVHLRLVWNNIDVVRRLPIQLVERQHINLEVAGSSPALIHISFFIQPKITGKKSQVCCMVC